MKQRRKILSVALAIVLSGLLLGCDSKRSIQTSSTSAEPVAPAKHSELTIEECKTLAEQMTEAIQTQDRAKLDRSFNLDLFLSHSLSNFSLSPEQQQQLAQNARAQYALNHPLVSRILAAIKADGSYRFLRVHEMDGRQRVMFRLLHPVEGVNYHDFVLARNPKGQAAIKDIFIFATGEMMSETFRRSLLGPKSAIGAGQESFLPATASIYLKNYPKIEQMNRALRTGKPKEAWDIFGTLPKELREEKSVLLFYFRAGTAIDEEHLFIAVEECRRVFPNDAGIDWLSVDYFRRKRKFDDALRCVDNTDKSVGGDPYLDSVRSALLLEAGRIPDAQVAAEKCVEREPTLPEGYYSRLNVAIRQKNHADALIWLKKVVEKTGEEIGDLTTDADYADFVKSPQYQEWLKWYAGRKKQ